jgi:N-acetylglucosaminyl-diphospho-decaprenol L-rhamnosyltransferase
MQRPSYAAVVLYYRLGESVADTVAALMAQSHPPQEVVVVDNASGDGVLHRLASERRIDPSVRVLQLDENHGYSGGMNRGIAALRVATTNVLLLTHEVLLEPSTLEQLSALSAGAVAVGPTLELPGGGVWSSGGYLTRTGRPRHHVDIIDGASRAVAWLDGACVLANRKSLDRIGGLDESFFLYWEDVDLGMRLNAVGQVLCASTARAQQATGTAPIYFESRNRLRYWRKHGPVTVTLVSLAELVLKLIVRDLPRRDRARLSARLAGIHDGLSNRSNAIRPNFVREKK